MNPLVSVIIPYFNRPEKLERCLSSIFSQSYKYYEILVVDDCSTIPFQKKHSDVIYLKNKMNSGPGISRNLGLKEAKGVFIAFLDCDDYWHRDFLETLITSLLSKPNAVMAYAEGYNVDANEKVIQKRRNKKIPPNCILPDILFKGRYWGTGGCLWRKKNIRNVEFLEFRGWEDYAFDIAVGIKNNTIVPVKKNLIYYDISGNDKLSNESEANYTIEKHGSIIAISELLLENNYKNDSLIKNSITILILLDIIRLLRLNLKSSNLIYENLKNIRKWQNLSFYLYVRISFMFPKKIRIRLLKELRNKVK